MKAEKDIFALLENPPDYKIDRDFEQEKEKISNKINISDEERALREKSSKLSDPRTRYVIDTHMGVLHDRSCIQVKAIPPEFLEVRYEFGTDYKSCKKCRLVAIVRSCLQNPEKLPAAVRFLTRLSAKAEDVSFLMLRRNASMRYLSPFEMEFIVNDDTWRINISGSRPLLLHNNYVVSDCHDREFTSGFHEQKVTGYPSFHSMSMIMANYAWADHRKERILAEEAELELAPDNEIDVLQPDTFHLSTAVRLKKFRLFCDRYIFVDTNQYFYKTVFRKRKIRCKVLQTRESQEFAYALVLCAIPKWHRRKVYSAVNEIKSKIYKSGHSRGYVCCKSVMDVLDRQAVRYTARL